MEYSPTPSKHREPIFLDAFLRIFQRHTGGVSIHLRAAVDINNALKQNDIESVFYSIQTMLNSAANIAKGLCGQGGKFADQRNFAKASMSRITRRKTVTMRNNFEHFDERLDRWWKSRRTTTMQISI